MKKRNDIDKIIRNNIYRFTHLWVDGFGWEPTIFQQSDFQKVIKLPENDSEGNIIYHAYNFDNKNNRNEMRKFKYERKEQKLLNEKSKYYLGDVSERSEMLKSFYSQLVKNGIAPKLDDYFLAQQIKDFNIR